MPRARTNGKLIRIPLPSDIAYEVTLCFPPPEGSILTPKQRLMALLKDMPTDGKLLMLKELADTMQSSTHPWGKAFRKNPVKGYKEEAEAVERALSVVKEFKLGQEPKKVR